MSTRLLSTTVTKVDIYVLQSFICIGLIRIGKFCWAMKIFFAFQENKISVKDIKIKFQKRLITKHSNDSQSFDYMFPNSLGKSWRIFRGIGN